MEPALACNIDCVMCPWPRFRGQMEDDGIMKPEIWNSLVPYLSDVKSVDFTGGGEPLMNHHLFAWLQQAKQQGCQAGFLTNGQLLNQEMSQDLISIGVDWVGFSIDGTNEALYERIRRGASFKELCQNIRLLARLRSSGNPSLVVNFVIMKQNVHQLEEMVDLAVELGVDQLNFKQCDVIRYQHGHGMGLFSSEDTAETRQYRKLLKRALKRARKMKLKTTVFSFVPDEQPVCDQNPGKSLFISYKGEVAPCINLAMGGPSEFMGADINFPTISYGNCLKEDLKDLWVSEGCRAYRSRFKERIQVHDRVLADSDFGSSLLSLRRAYAEAIKAMPDPPSGCRTCHYLYGI